MGGQLPEGGLCARGGRQAAAWKTNLVDGLLDSGEGEGLDSTGTGEGAAGDGGDDGRTLGGDAERAGRSRGGAGGSLEGASGGAGEVGHVG